MTKVQIAQEIRARLDRDTPDWRDGVRLVRDAVTPGWVAHRVTVRGPDGRPARVALLARPERVPDPAEIDPATDPFAGW